MRLRLVPRETDWNFFKYRKITFGASMVAIVLSLAVWLTVGLNFGIDFRGGTTIRTESTQAVDVAAYRNAIQPLAMGDVSISEVFDPTFGADRNVAMIRIQAQDGEESATAETVATIEAALALCCSHLAEPREQSRRPCRQGFGAAGMLRPPPPSPFPPALPTSRSKSPLGFAV